MRLQTALLQSNAYKARQCRTSISHVCVWLITGCGLCTGAIDKAIAECGEGRTDTAVADSLAGREPEPALQDIDEINQAFSAPTVSEILLRVSLFINQQ